MNIQGIMAELAETCTSIDRLRGRSYGYPVEAGKPIFVSVEYPETITYDDRGNGSSLSIPLVLVVSPQVERQAIIDFAPFVAVSGPESIKQAIENRNIQTGGPDTYDSARVQEVDFRTYSIAGQVYPAAIFTIDILYSQT